MRKIPVKATKNIRKPADESRKKFILERSYICRYLLSIPLMPVEYSIPTRNNNEKRTV
jgi:hypothetical protein